MHVRRSGGSLVLPAAIVAAVSGGIIAAQGQLNGQLAQAGAGSLVAGWFSYVGTLVTTVLVLVLRGRTRRTAQVLRRDARWWWFVVGLCGIPIVLGMAAGIPVVGVALASVSAVAGQTVASLGLDARGVGVPEPIRLTGRRLTAGLTAVAGLAVAVLGGSGAVDGGAVTSIVVGVGLFLSGAVLVGQQAGNGTVTAVAGDPVVAGLTSAAGGTAGITVLLGLAAVSGRLDTVTLPDPVTSWYVYLGGPLGALITIAAAWAVAHLGTFVLTLAVVGGQMVTAMLIDLAGAVGLAWPTVAATVMIGAATVLAVQPRRAITSTSVDVST
ncbi:DMT family transporter [Cellulomonas soli]|uniref:Membrane protein n=1 Tax=Cellulomonas soli TaxID=931535 RepID=A0A512PIB1_9CELL|nr:DMT family transporter [Cellulomonas soli]NYI58748.1 transporter family-2 protein [Cellulomonas soli]GEP70872.1 membrane protein [Cellulomonas soli]